MRSEDLLSLARELARREAGRPKSVSLRRAASTAYYALFHALARLCAQSLVGQKAWRHYTPIYRSLDHSRARSVLNALKRQQQAFGDVASAFEILQDLRHEADYSPEPFSLSRNGTLDLIDSAERAITTLERLTADEKLGLAVRLVVKPR